MNFSFSDDQTQIINGVSSMLAGEASYDRLFPQGFDEESDSARILALASEMGLIGFGAPESAGGSDAPLDDELLVQREAGRYILPLAIPAGAAAASLCSLENRSDVAQSICTGEAQVALAISGSENGEQIIVGRGELALRVDDETLSLYAIPGDIELSNSLDDGAPMRSVTLNSLEPSAVSSDPELYARFQLLQAAYQLGLAEAALQQSTDYAKEREQFGKAIGSFQAVRHRCVDMALRCEGAKSALFYAAVCLRDNIPGWHLQVLSAAWMADDAAVQNSRVNINNHGAIGVTCENIAHLLMKRALLCRQVGMPHSKLALKIANAPSPLST